MPLLITIRTRHMLPEKQIPVSAHVSSLDLYLNCMKLSKNLNLSRFASAKHCDNIYCMTIRYCLLDLCADTMC